MTYPNNITDMYQSFCQIQSSWLPFQRCAWSQPPTFIEKVLVVLYFTIFLQAFFTKGQTQASDPHTKSSNKVEMKLGELKKTNQQNKPKILYIFMYLKKADYAY